MRRLLNKNHTSTYRPPVQVQLWKWMKAGIWSYRGHKNGPEKVRPRSGCVVVSWGLSECESFWKGSLCLLDEGAVFLWHCMRIEHAVQVTSAWPVEVGPPITQHTKISQIPLTTVW